MTDTHAEPETVDRIIDWLHSQGITVADWQRDLLEQAYPTPRLIDGDRQLRHLPGTTQICPRCRGQIVWALTAARDTGPGGKAMPLDPVEHPHGNVAASPGHGRRLIARVLKKDEAPIYPVEFQAMPHFATCGKDTR